MELRVEFEAAHRAGERGLAIGQVRAHPRRNGIHPVAGAEACRCAESLDGSSARLIAFVLWDLVFVLPLAKLSSRVCPPLCFFKGAQQSAFLEQRVLSRQAKHSKESDRIRILSDL